ncbi:MAG: Do family serine endopeptidase [Pirellulales bacterium]
MSEKQTMRKGSLRQGSVGRGFAVGLVLLLVATMVAAALPTAGDSANGKGVPASAASLSEAFRTAAKEVQPAVVMIRNEPGRLVQFQGSPPDQGLVTPGDPFERFFRDPQLRQRFHLPRPGHRRGRSGIGSGVIIDPSGIILTSNHVVAGNGKVTVRLHDGREFPATQVLTDPKTDVAVVKIEGAEGLTAARLGESDAVEIGDWVLALGQPFGLEGTVTAGIISAKGRGIGIADRENFLQTDAAINPGNSGGPLVNLAGEVVGINTAISSNSGGNEGIGFAVPISLAKWVSDQLLSDGKVQRAQLGVLVQPMTHELAKQFGVRAREGVLVASVLPDSPAETAGLEPGDVILQFAGEKVTNPRHLQRIVERTPAGESRTIDVLRNGKKVTLSAICRIVSSETDTASDRLVSGATPSPFGKLGMTVSPLTDEVAERLGMQDVKGVVITSVEQGGPADRAGLSSGMVITQARRTAVRSVKDLQTAIEKEEKESGVLLLVRTGTGSRFVVVKPE